MVIYGTRPEAIKLAPVIRVLRTYDDLSVEVVSTGQHTEMLQPIIERFEIDPDYVLPRLPEKRSLNLLLSQTLIGLDEVFEESKPDLVLVQGDTTTALAAALAGFQDGAKVVHLEAGLRTGDIRAPFPEEANRKLISQIADLHCAPSDEARRNLLQEGTAQHSVVVTGNTVIDALTEAVSWNVSFHDSRLEALSASSRRVVLVTTHRRENLDKLQNIASALRTLALTFFDEVFVLPVHANPNVRDVVVPMLSDLPNLILSEPLPYDQFTKVLKRSHLVITDSGGLQEEAPALGIPVLVMRETTERREVRDAGAIRLIGTDPHKIVEETTRVLTDEEEYRKMAVVSNPYGVGGASAQVAIAMRRLLRLH